MGNNKIGLLNVLLVIPRNNKEWKSTNKAILWNI